VVCIRNCKIIISVVLFLPHDAMQSAVFVCLSICPSVTLRYRDHIGWNSTKIISQLVSVGCLLSVALNIMDLLQEEHPKFLSGIRVGYGKSGFRHTKALISPIAAFDMVPK